MDITSTFEKIDELMCAGQFEYLNEYLGSLDPSVHSVDEVITALVATFCACEKLSKRRDLYQRALLYYTEKLPDEVERLLEGLEQV